MHSEKKYALVLDVGTSCVKALLFDEKEHIVFQSSRVFSFSHPRKGWVEQDPMRYINYSINVLKNVLKKSGVRSHSIIGMGIANQRETIIAWDRTTSKPLYPAIVWQDRRTAALCKKLERKHSRNVRLKTGLDLIPYFSASKISWLLDMCLPVQKANKKKTLCIGTIDTWLMWNLLQGNPYRTDITNASRTLLYNIRTRKWDNQFCDIFGISKEVLARVVPSQNNFGITKQDVLGINIPLLAVCGDQQASMVGAGVKKNTTKITYGTGTFVMQVTGKDLIIKNPFFTTLLSWNNKTAYAVEGKIQYGGKEIEKYLSDKKSLQRHLTSLAKKVDTMIQQLPTRPRSLIIDGGVMRDGLMARIQEHISHIPVIEQKVYNGTALGIAKMIFKTINH